MSRKPTSEQKQYWEWLASKGCCVPLCGDPANIHHNIHERCDPDIEIRKSKDHWDVLPLCKFHHQDQKKGFHGVGSNWLFQELYGINLVVESERRLDEYRELQ